MVESRTSILEDYLYRITLTGITRDVQCTRPLICMCVSSWQFPWNTKVVRDIFKHPCGPTATSGSAVRSPTSGVTTVFPVDRCTPNWQRWWCVAVNVITLRYYQIIARRDFLSSFLSYVG